MEGSAEREIFKQLVGSRTRRTRQCLVFFVALICLLYGGEIRAEGVRGVFGVPSLEKVNPSSYLSAMEKAGVNAVFVPAEWETIQWFKSRGFKVFISVNAFGGTGGWKSYSDAQPVLAGGQKMDTMVSKYGGICPTHPAWRAERLKHIEDIVRQVGGPGGVDGIWLDFVRYPGFWETPENGDSESKRGLKPTATSAATSTVTLEGMRQSPIPDTCYCPRCLKKFQDDQKIKLPEGLSASEASAWIKKHHPYEWMMWKKEQINSFVREVRKIIDKTGAGFSQDIQDKRRLQPAATTDDVKRGLKSAATSTVTSTATEGRGQSPLLLGVFVTPWTKGEKDDAISYMLAQDAFALSAIVDVISPMIYHKMVGKPESWVGKMTAYYKETAKCEVWPIVQSVGTTKKELHRVVRYAGQAGADGILVFSYEGMKGKNPPQPPFKKGGKPEALTQGKISAAMWEVLKEFRPQTNLIRNSELKIASGKNWPEGWIAGENGKVEPARNIDKRIEESKSFNAIGITAGQGRNGTWTSAVQPCEPGQEYIFTGLFYRDHWANGKYPRIRVWDQEFYLNNHWLSGSFQPIRVFVKCPETIDKAGAGFSPRAQDNRRLKPAATDASKSGLKSAATPSNTSAVTSTFQFINYNPGVTFWMATPQLIKSEKWNEIGDSPYFRERKIGQSPISAFFYPGFFPIGVYGADINNVEQIKKLAINTVIIGGEGENLRKTIDVCRLLGLRYVLSVPHDPDRLKVYLDRLKPAATDNVKRGLKSAAASAATSVAASAGTSVAVTGDWRDIAFYVNDEPELRSFPISQADDVQRLIKDRFPEASTCMAVVRPQALRDYLDAADFFMMDQYPVPNMPMTWLSDSMDEAAGIVGRDRLVSIIQAFGGGANDLGWPRLPTWEEMDCLAFLSIIHGSRGIFFFTFSAIGKTEEGRQRLARVVGRLNQIYPWLLEQNLDRNVPVKITSTYGVDPKGQSAVQGAVKMRDGRKLFLLVNTIGTYVEAEIKIILDSHAALKKRYCKEVFSGERYPVINGTVHAKFNPYETKAFELDE